MSSSSSGLLGFASHSIDEKLVRLWDIGSGLDRAWKKQNLNDRNIKEAIRQLRGLDFTTSVYFAGPLLLGISLLYSRSMDSFDLTVNGTVHNIEAMLNPKHAAEPPSITKSSRKRRISQTPLPALPENGLLLDEDMLQLALPELPVSTSRTPISNRKRMLSTPRSTRHSSLEEEPVFESTPMLTPDMDSKRQKRMSSVSEVMDSLRADDGQRRLSGLLMTANGSVPPSPSVNDHFDTGIDPPSPWDDVDDDTENLLALPPLSSPGASTVARSAPRQKKQVTKRTLLDRRGKWSIEIDPSKVKERREWYLSESKFYMQEKSVDKCISFKLGDLLRDRTSHFRWYKPPGKSRFFQPVTEAEGFESYDMPDFEYDEPSPESSIHIPREPDRSVVELLEKSSSPVDLKSLLEQTSASRRTIANNFVQLLNLATLGKAQIKSEDTLSFTSAPSVWVSYIAAS